MRADGQPTTRSDIAPVQNGGIGFMGLLTALFVGLKLTGIIDWSWLWVLAPLWLSFALFLVVLGLAVAVFVWVEARSSRTFGGKR